jgi:hypothetical protein
MVTANLAPPIPPDPSSPELRSPALHGRGRAGTAARSPKEAAMVAVRSTVVGWNATLESMSSARTGTFGGKVLADQVLAEHEATDQHLDNKMDAASIERALELLQGQTRLLDDAGLPPISQMVLSATCVSRCCLDSPPPAQPPRSGCALPLLPRRSDRRAALAAARTPPTSLSVCRLPW